MKYTIELTVPAVPGMMIVVRMTAAGVLARAEATLEAMEDFKMAVEEACLYLIQQKAGFAALRLRFAHDDQQVSLQVTGEDGARQVSADDEEPYAQDVLQGVLESMADRVSFTKVDGVLTAILMSRRFKEEQEADHEGCSVGG